MNSYQLIKEINKIEKKLSPSSNLYNIISSLGIPHNDKLNDTLYSVIAAYDDESISSTHFKTLLEYLSGEVKEEIQKISPRIFFLSIEELRQTLLNSDIFPIDGLFVNLDGRIYQPDVFVREVINLADNFMQTYEDYLKNDGLHDALRTIHIANRLLGFFDWIFFGLISVKQKLEVSYELEENTDTLSILLASEIHFTDFPDKIKVLSSLYSELCILLNISEISYPIQTIKIESGSFWAKIFGESKVIKLMTDLIRNAAGYLYRNFTKEGKISSIPIKAESIEKILKLSEKLKKNGIDTSQMQDNISKAGVVISKELNTLLLGQPAIELNEEPIYLVDVVQAKYIEESKRLMLEQKDSAESNSD